MPLTPEQRLEVAQAILDFEARRDSRGRLVVYALPKDDGGGSFEVAGINDKYDHAEAVILRDLVQQGRYDEAEHRAVAYIAENTNPAAAFEGPPAVEAFLRDCVFNRGRGGTTRILQRGLAVTIDGKWGPNSKRAFTAMIDHDIPGLLKMLRRAREWYERQVVGRDESSHFWKGLVHRWDNALEMARKFLPEPPKESPPV